VIGERRRKLAAFAAFSWIWFGSLNVGALAQGQPEPFRPLVFIPGILGTELLDEHRTVVWGDSSSLSNFEKLELGVSPSQPALHPGGLIKSINVLGPFWTIHQYDGLLSVLQALNYHPPSNVFISIFV
jgi:hypothetical protein